MIDAPLEPEQFNQSACNSEEKKTSQMSLEVCLFFLLAQ